METVESIPSAKRTFQALRSLGYDLNSSVADLVDNSISAGSKNIYVLFKHIKGDFYLRVYDDGKGMSEKELEEAMRLGAEAEYQPGDLGKFGMGMKTASLSHCNILTVISKKKSLKPAGFSWDMDHVSKSNEWELLKLNDKSLNNYLDNERMKIEESGTIVFWDDLFVIDNEYRSYNSEKLADNYYYRILGKLKLHLRMVFHRFLDNSLDKPSTVNIIVNDEHLDPWDPFCRNESETFEVSLKKELSELSFEEYQSAVRIKAFVLPSKDSFSSEVAWKNGKGLLSWNDAQGYYIYRANRLIRFGGWQGTMAKDEHIKLARLSIDIDPELDDLFQVTVNKNKVQFPEKLYYHLKTNVNKTVVKKAKKAYKTSPSKPAITNSFRNQTNKVEQLSKGLTKENNISTHVNEVSETFDVEIVNQNGSWLSNQVQEFMEYGTDRDFEVVSGEVESGHLWKIIGNVGEKFKVIVNEKHPFYSQIYESGKGKSVTAAIDALIFSLAFAELFNRNEDNAHLFETFKTVCGNTLERLVKEKII